MIARGFGSRFPHAARLRVKLLSRMMFIGEPCPTNKTGILSFNEPSN
jgi:hypothetical protein